MELRAEPGTLLAAWPDLQDPNFQHSVVLVVQHTDEGAFGLVLNRPLDATVDQLLPEHPVLGALRTRVHLGGPVDHTRMQFLHRCDARVPGGHLIVPGLWLGGELEALAELLAEPVESAESAESAEPAADGCGESSGEGDAGADVRLFVGYAGWGAGQLEDELASGSWLPAAFEPRHVFEGAGEPAWRAVVRSVEGAEELANTPPDVTWN